MTTSLKTASDIFPVLMQQKNDSSRDRMVMLPSSFDSNTTKSKTIQEYLQKLSVGNDNNYKIHKNESQSDEKVFVITWVGDYDETFEQDLGNVTELYTHNKSLNYLVSNKSDTQGSEDYYLEKGDIQKYVNDYQDFLYTFKDIVKMGVTPNIEEKSSKLASEFGGKEALNLTFVMPIINTRKYFEIKLSNLTQTQYNEIQALIQEYKHKKSNSSINSGSKQQRDFDVELDGGKKRLTSRALSGPLNLHRQVGEIPTSHNYDSSRDYNKEMDFFYKVFSPKLFEDMKSNRTNTSFDTKFETLSEHPTTKSNIPLVKNNGFHAEIATDYVHKHEEENTQVDYHKNSGGQRGSTGESDSSVGVPRRNRTKLFLQTRSKRPIMSAPVSMYNRRYEHFNSGSNNSQPDSINNVSLISGKLGFGNIENTLPTSGLGFVDKEPQSEIYSTITTHEVQKNTEEISTEAANRQELHLNSRKLQTSLINNGTLKTSSVFYINDQQTTLPLSQTPYQMRNLSSQHVMDAALWLIDMKKKIEEEEKRKTERYKNYIKQFLKYDNSSIVGRGEDGNVMKINKHEDILQEIKMQMLEYFSSLNLNNLETISNNATFGIESILNATNVFEVMEKSSQFVKQRLQTKIYVETKEPVGFIKQVADKQVEKCKKHMNTNLIPAQTSNITKKNSQRRFLVFTKCVNWKIKRCILGFSGWLRKGKFYLRPRFKINRAYENYEIEQNLYCLRNYSPSQLDSNRHGVRVKPGPKVDRKFRAGKTRPRQNKPTFRIRKTGNRHHEEKQMRPSQGSRRKNKQENSKQQPRVERYSDKQRVASIVREHGENSDQSTKN